MVALLDSAILRNLHLGGTTLYDLCDEDDEALPVIIDRAFGQSIHVEMNGTPAARNTDHRGACREFLAM